MVEKRESNAHPHPTFIISLQSSTNDHVVYHSGGAGGITPKARNMHISSLGFSEIKLLSATCPGALPYYTWARGKTRNTYVFLYPFTILLHKLPYLIIEGEAKKNPEISY